MNSFRFSVGIILIILAFVSYFYIEDAKNTSSGEYGMSIERYVQSCNSNINATGIGGILNALTVSCLKFQLFYYSPWIAGFFAIIFLLKARPYRGYSGVGGVGSHGKRFKFR